MLLNNVEYLAMNNPLRAWVQRHVEARRLLKMGGRTDGARALEIGCGRGVGAEIILDMFGAATLDAFDLDPRMIAKARRRLQKRGDTIRVWVGHAEDIDADDASYDVVFDFGIIHHVLDWRTVLNEVYRVLKPGGRIFAEEVLRAFILNPLWKRLVNHPTEDRFDQDQFLARLELTGFNVLATRRLGRSFAWFVAEKPLLGKCAPLSSQPRVEGVPLNLAPIPGSTEEQ